MEGGVARCGWKEVWLGMDGGVARYGWRCG